MAFFTQKTSFIYIYTLLEINFKNFFIFFMPQFFSFFLSFFMYDFWYDVLMLSKPWDFTPNQGNLLQTKGIYSKLRDFTPNQGSLLLTQGVYSKPGEFTPNPREFAGNFLRLYRIRFWWPEFNIWPFCRFIRTHVPENIK